MEEKKTTLFFLSIKWNPPLPPPLLRRVLKAEEERTGGEPTYLVKRRYSRFQVFHDIPIIRSGEVQISVWEAYPFQQDVQELRDIVSPDIEKDPEQRRKHVEKTEGEGASETNHLMLGNHEARSISVQRRGFLTWYPVLLARLRRKQYLSLRLRCSRHKRLKFRLRRSWPRIPIKRTRKLTSQLNCSSHRNETFQVWEMKWGEGADLPAGRIFV